MRRIGYLAIGWAVLAAGCSSSYSQKNLKEPSAKLMRGKSVVIATPANGRYSNREYTESGQMTALAVRDAFARLTDSVTVSAAGKDLNSLKADGSTHFDYYVVPESLHWEERKTEWFGFPDRIHVKLSVYDGTTWARSPPPASMEPANGPLSEESTRKTFSPSPSISGSNRSTEQALT